MASGLAYSISMATMLSLTWKLKMKSSMHLIINMNLWISKEKKVS
jgi:hypothetical protein